MGQKISQQLLKEALAILNSKGGDETIFSQLKHKIMELGGQVEETRDLLNVRKQLPKMDKVQTMIMLNSCRGFKPESETVWPEDRAKF